MSQSKNQRDWEEGLKISRRRSELAVDLARNLCESCGWVWGYSGSSPVKVTAAANAIFVPERGGVERCFTLNSLLSKEGMEEVFFELIQRDLWEKFFLNWLDNVSVDPCYYEMGPPLSIGILTYRMWMTDTEGQAIAAIQTFEDDRKEG